MSYFSEYALEMVIRKLRTQNNLITVFAFGEDGAINNSEK